MHYAILVATLAALATASPLQPRAVFKATTFNDISIAGGTAGKAQQEAAAALSGLPTDLKTVTSADLDFLNQVNQVANDAETEAFNTAIDAASGDAADALQVSVWRAEGGKTATKEKRKKKEKKKKLETRR